MSDVPTPARAPSPSPAPSPRRAPLLTVGQLIVAVVAVLATVASVIALVTVLPPAVRAADPARPVRAYLEAVVGGHVAEALKIGRVTPAKGDKLLTDAAYAHASDRVTAFTLLGTSLDGDTATVQARLTQGGTRYVAAFTVERAPGFPVLAPWRLAKQQLPELSAKLSAPVALSVTVGGVALTPAQGAITQHVLPGSYAVKAASSDLFTATGGTVSATFGGRVAPLALEVALTDAGTSAATAQVDSWLQQCAASADLAPAGCPFEATPQPATSYSNGRWSIQSQPQLTTGAWNAELGGWPVTTSAPGYITFTADAQQGGLSGTATTGSKPFSVAGTAVPDSAGLRFVPSPAYSAGGAGALT